MVLRISTDRALPPGPRRPSPAQLHAWITEPERLYASCRRRFGPTFTLRLFGQPPKVFVSDPADVRAVFRGSDEVLHAGRANAVVEPIVGSTSILVLDGSPHRVQRRVLAPLFRGRAVQPALGDLVALCERAVADLPRGEAFALLPHAQALTLRIILAALLGVRQGPELDALYDRTDALMRIAGHPLLLVPPARRRLGSLTPWARFDDHQQALRADLAERFARARVEPDRTDLLARIVHAGGEGGPERDVELADAVLTLLVAGHETSATGLAWAMHHLAHHPGEQERLRADLRAAFGDGPVDVATLAEIPRLTAIIYETLRLTPPLTQVGRILAAPFEVGGYSLPAGVGVVPCIWLAHRDPAQWPEPERFLPERFLPLERPDPSAWFPFGGGARRCLGESFAMHELRAALAVLVLRCRVQPAGAPSRARRRGVVLAPGDGVRLRIAD